MKNTYARILLGVVLSLGLFLLWQPVFAHDDPSHTDEEVLFDEVGMGGTNEELDELNKTIAELKEKIGQLQSERNTLSSNITFLNSKILLNEKEIEKTEKEILALEAQVNDLGERIKGLEGSLKELSVVLVERIQDQYKRGSTDQVSLVFATTGLSNFFKEHKYLAQTREHTQQLLLNTETKKQTYDEEKASKEAKQAQVQALQNKLESQQKELEVQRADKQKLLDVTKNDEKVYQQRLAEAMAEFSAIQSIIAGAGKETEVGDVKQGDKIASIIAGPSTCSTGAHLHLEVVKGGAHVNPASYLKGASVDWLDASFDLGGSWEWPLENPARVTQGYGMTSFARSGFYGGKPHTGIDMLSKSSGNWTVKAIQEGKLYRGSISCRGGQLRYVRVKHADEVSSYYLHVNY